MALTFKSKIDDIQNEELALIIDKESGNIIQKIFISKNKKNKEDQSSKIDKLIRIKNNTFELLDYDYVLQLSPTHDKDQNIRMLIVGASGSGKTRFAANFIKEYKIRYPKKDIFLFSTHEKDESIDDTGIVRISISENEIIHSIKTSNELIPIDKLKDSLVVFDDVYGSSKILTKYYFNLCQSLVQNGRKYNIDIITILHNTQYSDTRYIFSEGTYYVLFLQGGAKASLTRILKQYLGFDNSKEIKKLFNLPSRYVIFKNTNPQCIITENEIFFEEE